jgi:hypothetical protein
MHTNVLKNTYRENVKSKEAEGEGHRNVSTAMAGLGRNRMAEKGSKKPSPRKRVGQEPWRATEGRGGAVAGNGDACAT